MSQWVRLWDDMPTDPKWRVIARKSGQSIGNVMAVFNFMLICAASATERGELIGWDDEDVGAALDIDSDQIAAIREAMQGKVLDGARLKGWEKRQPIREDGAAERSRAWREKEAEKKRLESLAKEQERTQTQPNAQERPEENREDTDKKESPSLRSDDSVAPAPPTARKRKASTVIAQELPIDWQADDSDREYAIANFFPPSLFEKSLEDMRLWAKANRIRKHDWHATLKGFMRRDAEKLAGGSSNARAGPAPSSQTKPIHFFKRGREILAKRQADESSNKHTTIDESSSDEPSAFSRSFDLSADTTS
jgi:hypothetical protein